MSFALVLLGLVAAGLGLLKALRLATGRLSVDLALAWFLGSGWFALGVGTLRFLFSVPYTAATAVGVILVPLVGAWISARARRGDSATIEAHSARWVPRPPWVFAPLALFVAILTLATALHGIDTPTHTSDGLRLRAFTPVLAFLDEWSPEARELLPLAGTLPTWAPTLAWRLTGTLDHFHVNYTVVTTLLATLLLVIGLGAARGRPEEGWAGAFALLSLPLFVYHCTSTYTDAVLAMYLGVGFLFFLEYERARAPADAARALLLLACAAMVKREGTLLALVTAAPFVLQMVWRRRSEPAALRWILALAMPLVLDLVLAVRAVGVGAAFPMVATLAGQLAETPEAAGAGGDRLAAARAFAHALFRSGNAGMLYWVLGAVLVLRVPALLRARRAAPLAALALLFGLCAASSIWLLPAFTLDGTTVHRALLAVSVPSCLWLAATVVGWASAEPLVREPGPGPAPWPRALVFVLAVGLCYANSLGVPFLLDDPRPAEPLDYSTRPLVWASFALNRALGGSVTVGFHVFNALVHLACGLLLFAVLRRTLALATSLAAQVSANLAFVTTLLWLCHPLQTESVTYLSQRAESLGALTYLLVFHAFLRSLESPRPRVWRALVLVFLALGFATKETIATAPLALFLYDAVFVARGFRAALRARAGFYALLVLIAAGLAGVFVLPPLLGANTSAGFQFMEFGALDYARTQPGVLLHYLGLVLWPVGLCFDYGWPIAREARDFAPQTLVLTALLAATLVLLGRRHWAGFAGAFFFLYLAPTSSIVPIRDPAFEHRMYLPLAAVLALLVGLAWRLLARLPRAATGALAGAAVVVLAALTVRRNHDYRSGLALWTLTAEQAPLNPRAHGNLGAAYFDAGRMDEAMEALYEAMRLDPDDPYNYLNLGKACLKVGQKERAISLLKLGLSAVPDAAGYAALGTALLDKGELEEAVVQLEKSLAKLADASVHFRLANALGRLQRSDEALAHFQEALRLEPEFQDAHVNLAALLAALDRPDEALTHVQAALAIPPDSALELYNSGQLFVTLGRAQEAKAAFRAASAADPSMRAAREEFVALLLAEAGASPAERWEALRFALEAHELSPAHEGGPRELCVRARAAAGDPGDDAAAQGLVGRALLAEGDAAGALVHLARAVALEPASIDARMRLARALAGAQRAEPALAEYRECLRLAPALRVAHIEAAAQLVGLGRAAEALEHAQRALALPPESATDSFNLGQLLIVLGRSGEALVPLRAAIRAAPERLEPYLVFATTVASKPDVTPDERWEALALVLQANELTGSSRTDVQALCSRTLAAVEDSSADPERCALLGRARALEEDFEGARAAYQREVELRPGDAGAHERLAGVLARLARAEEALAHFEEALRLAPRSQVAHLGLAELFSSLGQAEEALAHRRKALELLPDSVQELFEFGQALAATQRWPEALAIFDEVARTEPTRAEAFAAFAAAVAAKPDASQNERREALRMALRANELTGSGNAEYKALCAAARRALGEPLGDARSLRLLAQALLLEGDARGALARFEQAVELDPRDPVAHCGLAHANALLQRTSEAIRHYEEALLLQPDAQEAHLGLVGIFAGAGQLEPAMEHARRAGELQPNTVEELFTLGQLLRAGERFAESLEAFRGASRIDPALAEPYVALAETACMKPDVSRAELEEALDLARKASDLSGSRRPDYLAVVALTQAALGDFESAVRTIDEALKLPMAIMDPELQSRLRAQRDEYAGKLGR